LREGVDTIEVDNGKFRFVVVPTRGMGLWKGWLGDLQVGWNSPVKGPVHPQYVPITDPGGLGWLEGFDELMCRCGLESNGAPDIGPAGVYKYPLHGRIANRPAHYVELVTDDQSGEIRLTGLVDETRFLFQKLRLKSTYITKVGQSGLRILDEVTNLSGSPAEMQLLYHVNFGAPILDPGAQVVAPIKTVMPRDPRAAQGIGTWESYPNEEAGYAEQVYFFELLADSSGMTQVLLKNAHATQGVSLRFAKTQLPCFTLWKNTPTAADGYVTGLEPGTNFPNPRSFETEQGRVIKLQPGETAKFEITLEVYADAQSVSTAEEAIARLRSGVKPKVFSTPQPGWTKPNQI
jgi:galactose mutarotase-like enzyme